MGDQDHPEQLPADLVTAEVTEAIQAVQLEAANAAIIGSASEIEVAADQLQAIQELVKIYVGALPPDLDEDALRILLNEKNLPEAETVLVKRGGYAFLEFTDQPKADEVIAVIDGLDHHGYTLKAEMSVGSEKKR